jgi:hypothetical protein
LRLLRAANQPDVPEDARKAVSIIILPDYSRRCLTIDPDDSHLFKSVNAVQGWTH